MSKYFLVGAIVVDLTFLLGCGGQDSPAESAGPIGDAGVIAVHIDQADIDAGRIQSDELIERGLALMVASFNTLDGAGRPETSGTGEPRSRREAPDNFNRISSPDSNACSGCHNLPGPGGGGDNVANVFVLAQAHEFVTFGEDQPLLTLQNVGNERNTLGMFGSGFIELLAREMTFDLLEIRDQALEEAASTGNAVRRELVTKGVHFGEITIRPDGSLDASEINGVDDGLIIKPFHQKGAVISLRQFTDNAMNHHHGMQAAERFGDGVDPDGDGIVNELTRDDLTAITIFQATLPAPGQVIPQNQAAQEAVDRGTQLFSDIGRAVCHVSQLRLNNPTFTEPNPFNPPGNLQLSDVPQPLAIDLTKDGPSPHLERESDGSVLVPVFTDLKRHKMGDVLNNEKLEQDGIPTDEWLTRKLWGFASEPPFLHHGRATLISEAILMHGGEAQQSRDIFGSLSPTDQAAVVEFLKSLQILPDEPSNRVAAAALTGSAGSGVRTLEWATYGVLVAVLLVASLGAVRRNRVVRRK